MTDPNHAHGEPVHSAGEEGSGGPIQRLVAASITEPLLVAFLALAIVFVGIYSLRRLPVDAYPDVSSPHVNLTTAWPGHAAEEVERLITIPLEVAMNGLPNVVVTRSVSLYGLSSVNITFTDDADLYFAREQVFEHIGDASLPTGVTPGMEAPFSPSGLVYRVGSSRVDLQACKLEYSIVSPK